MGLGYDYDFNRGFNSMRLMFILMFVIVIGVFVAVAIFVIRTWKKNNASPKLTVFARVVSKRMDISESTTWYYVTFQVESGDRMELCVSNMDYGMLAEQDEGSLSFQGTRYLGFKRL